MNTEDKMLQFYLQNLEKAVQSLCKIVNTLVSDDQIVYDAYESLKELVGQIKYFEKFNNKQLEVSKLLSESISIINAHSEHQSTVQGHQKDQLIFIKNPQKTNVKGLATIAQKQSQQNLLHNYIRKQSKRKILSKYRKVSHENTKTINDQASYLNTSRDFEIIREETRRSLDNSGPSYSEKKPLYKQLQKFKGAEFFLPAVKEYLDKHNHKRSVISKNANYTIAKFL